MHADFAIEQLYHDHGAALLQHLTRLIGDRLAAEDLCQDTFLKAWRGWEAAQPIANRVAWLYRIATNTAYDYMRRGKRIRFAPLYESDESIDRDSMELRLDAQEPVQRALAQLSPDARRLLVLSSCAGHSAHELAAALECSDVAVRLRLFRARARFRALYLQQSAN
jgi:RNA polymerase sigma-70 factor (ECF subfamily)